MSRSSGTLLSLRRFGYQSGWLTNCRRGRVSYRSGHERYRQSGSVKSRPVAFSDAAPEGGDSHSAKVKTNFPSRRAPHLGDAIGIGVAAPCEQTSFYIGLESRTVI